MTAFIITRDHIEDDDPKDVEVFGPRGLTDKDKDRLRAGEGIEFQLLDDDRELYYEGRRLEESDCDHWYGGETELAPLDCWGMPNAGCTQQRERDAKGIFDNIN